MCAGQRGVCSLILFVSVSQQNAKKRKLEDGGGEDKGEYKTIN